jgi:TIR domain
MTLFDGFAAAITSSIPASRTSYGYSYMAAVFDPNRSIFICYAHEDNADTDPRRRWLDRLLQFLRPLVRQEGLNTWSDRNITIGENWQARIKHQLELSRASVLIVSPAFLASDYIANSELPVLLKHAADHGTPILPMIVSPCFYEKSRFKFPEPKTGPNEVLLSSLQSVNPPSRTLVEMSEGEQNRVLLTLALRLADILVEYDSKATNVVEDVDTHPGHG